MILEDGTRISLGPATELSVDKFIYEPAVGKLDLLVKLVRGLMAYVSGRIGQISPEASRVETPVGIIGLRGTHFGVSLEGF